MKNPVHIRPLRASDRAAWDALWAGYLIFYKTELDASVSDHTFARLVDGELIGLVACDGDETGAPLGIAHAMLHAGTWSPKPVCYLEDLYVSEAARGRGVGRALIEHLAEQGRNEGWLRLYWQTASDNTTAQKLYDRVAERTDWVRYELEL